MPHHSIRGVYELVPAFDDLQNRVTVIASTGKHFGPWKRTQGRASPQLRFKPVPLKERARAQRHVAASGRPAEGGTFHPTGRRAVQHTALGAWIVGSFVYGRFKRQVRSRNHHDRWVFELRNKRGQPPAICHRVVIQKCNDLTPRFQCSTIASETHPAPRFHDQARTRSLRRAPNGFIAPRIVYYDCFVVGIFKVGHRAQRSFQLLVPLASRYHHGAERRTPLHGSNRVLRVTIHVVARPPDSFRNRSVSAAARVQSKSLPRRALNSASAFNSEGWRYRCSTDAASIPGSSGAKNIAA